MSDYSVATQQSSNGKPNSDKNSNILESIFITDDTKVPPIEPILKIRDATMLIKRDFMYITGLPKAGKTAIAVPIIATALLEHIPESLDHLEIRTSYCRGKPVFYIDNEQPTSYTKRILDRIKKMLNVEKKPDNLYIVNLRRFSDPKKKKEAFFALMNAYPDTHLWVVDGLADFMKNVNDPEESAKLTGELISKCDELDTSIICYLHESRSNERMRGHAGAEGERKAGSVARVRKDKNTGYHFIECLIIREGKEFEPVGFKFCEEAKMWVTLNEETMQKVKEEKGKPKFDKLQKLAQQCFVGGAERVPYKELINRIRSYDSPPIPCSTKTANNRRNAMLKEGIIKLDKEEKKYYYCKLEKDNNSASS